MNKTDRNGTIINLTRITVLPEHREELCQTISSLIEPVQRGKGCLTYRLYEDVDDENTFVLIGEWKTPDAWSDYLNSDDFPVLLGSIKLLCGRAPIDYKLLSSAEGVEAAASAEMECHR